MFASNNLQKCHEKANNWLRDHVSPEAVKVFNSLLVQLGDKFGDSAQINGNRLEISIDPYDAWQLDLLSEKAPQLGSLVGKMARSQLEWGLSDVGIECPADASINELSDRWTKHLEKDDSCWLDPVIITVAWGVVVSDADMPVDGLGIYADVWVPENINRPRYMADNDNLLSIANAGSDVFHEVVEIAPESEFLRDDDREPNGYIGMETAKEMAREFMDGFIPGMADDIHFAGQAPHLKG